MDWEAAKHDEAANHPKVWGMVADAAIGKRHRGPCQRRPHSLTCPYPEPVLRSPALRGSFGNDALSR